MALSKSGKHFFNPARAREHDRNMAAPKPAPGKANVEGDGQDGGEHGGVQKAEHFHPDHPGNPSPGKHHLVLHHADGHEEHSDHESAEEAHEHHGGALDQSEEVGREHNVDTEHENEGVCPECGGELIDGKCAECGYDEAGHSAEENEGENGNY